jgi:hypothetical protein
MRQAEPTSMPVDIRAHARRRGSARAWLLCALAGVAAFAVLAWSFGAMVDDLDSGSFWLPFVCIVGFMLALSAAIYAWFELERLSRLRRADTNWPGSFVVPFIVTKQLPRQVGDAATSLGHRLHLPSQGFGLLVADATAVRILTGWAMATDLTVPRTSLGVVELGAIEFPFGTAVSVDIVLATPGDVRMSFMPERTPRWFFGKERTPIIEQYVEELRTVLQLEPDGA